MNIFTLSPKICMSHLLLKDSFDPYLFIEGEITTFNTFRIDGYLQKEFYDTRPEDDYARWKEQRDFFFQIIRGKRTPLGFRIVLSLAPEQFSAFLAEHQISACRPEDIQGLYLNFRYDGSTLQCVTGVSTRTFIMDKTLEHEWDQHAEKLLAKMGSDPLPGNLSFP